MKYVFPIGVFGGQGGAPYSHEDDLKAAGLRLGAGPGSSRLSSLHVEAWGSGRILSHHAATYTSLKDPSKTFTTPGQGNIKASPGTDFVIPADSRVARVCASYGDRAWMSGGACLEFLEIETAPVGQAGQNAQASVGTCFVDAENRATGSHGSSRGGICKVVDIPDGMTLAGIEGKAGDSWDQVSLLVCPWLPMGGKWDCHMHKHLLAPFRQQARTLLLCLQQLQASGSIRSLDQGLPVQLVAALFEVTLFGDDQPSTPDSQQAGSTTSQQVATRAAAARRPAAARPAAAAPAVQQDFIQVWMQQEVRQAMQDSEVALSFTI